MMKCLDLSGIWRYETDINDVGIEEKFYTRKLKNDNFILPGDACSNRVGTAFSQPEEMTRETVRHLTPAYSYVGVLWLQRTFTLHEEYENKSLSLFLERVNIASDLWIDDKKLTAV